MKKVMSLLLSVTMVLSLAACGGNDTKTDNDIGSSATQNQTDVTDTSSTEQSTDTSSSITDNIGGSDSTDVPSSTISKPTTTTKPETTKPSTPTHTHSYSNATCTAPAKCSCGATNGSTIPHNYKDGICTMCKKGDPSAKSSEISKENERHNQVLAELKESRDYLVDLNRGRINDIKSAYGISYVYDDVTCVVEISSLDSEISDLDFELSRLEMYNDPADRRRIAELRSQINNLKSQKTMYEQMRKIHNYEYAIESHESDYQSKVAAENKLHQENLSKIESKYNG